MEHEWIQLTAENIATEHLCCIIRSKMPHAGVEAKREWLSARIREGHIFRKLPVKGVVFIEYAPLETAWVPVVGEQFYYIYCLWVDGAYKGKGYAKALMESCIADAQQNGKSGICMLGATKQKAWLSNQSFAQKFGFEIVDTTDYGYTLLALSLDGSKPSFAPNVRAGTISSRELTVFYDAQCPFILQRMEQIRDFCVANAVPHSLIRVDSLQAAKELPCVFNNWAVFYAGKFVTVNLLDVGQIQKLLTT